MTRQRAMFPACGARLGICGCCLRMKKRLFAAFPAAHALNGANPMQTSRPHLNQLTRMEIRAL
nr:MAG TPA: hypothetical protein [Caudoviricetes sp.]